MTGAESGRLDRIEKKLDDVYQQERAQLLILKSIVDLFGDLVDEKRARQDAEDRHRELTGPGRHLRLVREE